MFDSGNLFVDHYEATIEQLSESGDHLPLQLPAGHYTALIWGGTLDTYTVGDGAALSPLVRGISAIDDFRVALNKRDADSRADTPSTADFPSSLFYGSADIELLEGESHPVVVSLIKDTSMLSFHIHDQQTRAEDVSPGWPSDPYNIFVDGDNTMFDHSNNIAPEAPVLRYTPVLASRRTGIFDADVPMSRIIKGVPLNTVIEDARTGTRYLDADLMEIITANPAYATQSEIDREDLFDIDVYIDKDADVSVTIVINGWQYVYVTPEL
jgi:hypothetical protein